MAAKNPKTEPAAESVEAVTAEAVKFLLAQTAIASPRDANKAKDLSARLTAAQQAQE
jgi:hypothetical protein